MNAKVSIAVLALGLALGHPVFASDAGYIYGRVETVDGDTYEGQLRWGKEESFWDDIFNATKVENENLDYLDRKTLSRIRRQQNFDWDFIFGNKSGSFTHVFAIRFGDLKRIRIGGGEDLVVTFRNDEEMRLEGGSNDVGAVITVADAKRGQHELNWNRIRTIDFANTPTKLAAKLGEPIYGTVKSGRLDFTGRIQWDHDECLTVDRLDGDTEDGRVHLAFADIKAIRKYRNGVLVALKSGEEQYVYGSNDVNQDNRGVVIIVPGVGSVKVGWDDFDEVTFSAAPNSGRGYAEYAKEKNLNGTVVTREGRYEGRIVYDLDESRDFELLQGTNGDTEYLIPFRDIARIKPLGWRRADVELHNGLTIELRGSQDVTRENSGLLVFSGNNKPTYVGWQDVTEVIFR